MTDSDSTPKKAKHGEAAQFMRDAVVSSTDDCIVWPFCKLASGYGSIGRQGKTTRAHRLALSLATGVPMSDPREAAHGECHNRSCINPRHLSWKTRSENQQDRLRDGTDARGENHGNAKLTEQKVLEIFHSTESLSVLAKRHGTDKSNISLIKRGKNWGWLTGAIAKTPAQISG